MKSGLVRVETLERLADAIGCGQVDWNIFNMPLLFGGDVISGKLDTPFLW